MSEYMKDSIMPVHRFIGGVERYDEVGGDEVWFNTSDGGSHVLLQVHKVSEQLIHLFQDDESLVEYQNKISQFVTDAINEKIENMNCMDNNKFLKLCQVEMFTNKAKILLVEKPIESRCIFNDVSDGFLKFAGVGGHIPPISLPHKNYKILGMVAEALDSMDSNHICDEIVDCYGLAVGYRNYKKPEYLNYIAKTPTESFKSLLLSYGLNPNDVMHWEILIEKQ